MKQFVYIALFASLTSAIRQSNPENKDYQGLVSTLGVSEANEVINKAEYNEVKLNTNQV